VDEEVSEMLFGKVKDPVCGMKISKRKAAGAVEHHGKLYYFCSKGCREKFEKEPKKYVETG
jgi:YHS domain-containing protein